MKSFAICALLAAGVSAIPMAAPNHVHLHHKRDVVVVTQTDVDLVTERVTKTVWVTGGDHVEHHHKPTATAVQTTTVQAEPEPTTTSSAAPAPETSSTTSVYVAPTTTSVYVAPTTTSVDVAPTTTSVYVAPTTTTAYTPPPVPTTTSVYVAPTTTTTTSEAPAYTTPAATSSSSSGASETSGTGNLSYYAVGLGSCGWTNTDSEDVVAMAARLMSDKSKYCGQEIAITYNGKTHNAKIVDTCPGCGGSAGLDLSPTLFQKFDNLDVGILPDATWTFV